jgi:polyferredoxin
MPYSVLADLVLALHVGIVVFVVLGAVLIPVGNGLGWHWVNRLWFRLAHLGAIATVVAEAWLGIICPLTTLEMWLRSQTQTVTYDGGFIAYWLQQILYYDLPAWVFIAGYSLFGLLVVALWWFFPPQRKKPK